MLRSKILFCISSLFSAHNGNLSKQPVVFIIGPGSEEEFIEQPGGPAAETERPDILNKQWSVVGVQESPFMLPRDGVKGLNVSTAKITDQDAVAEGSKICGA